MKKKIKRIIVSRFADDDLNEIIEYYYSLSKNYVQKTIELFEHNIKSLKDFPERGRFVPELERQGITKFRELIQGNYRIVYEINNDIVIVHTIIDSRRNFEQIIFSKLMRYY
ncbi:MAG: type II toxin-antitoxin system RelE/ParE family toxin [Bacteroidales bacterium]|nr:type II toxin-antitoxin system RelE/ParE family toxin [Bacteroidales bacterium]